MSGQQTCAPTGSGGPTTASGTSIKLSESYVFNWRDWPDVIFMIIAVLIVTLALFTLDRKPAAMTFLIVFGFLIVVYINQKMGKLQNRDWPPTLSDCPNYFIRDVDGETNTTYRCIPVQQMQDEFCRRFPTGQNCEIIFDKSSSFASKCAQARDTGSGFTWEGCI